MINCIIVDRDASARKAAENLISQVRHIHIIRACSSLSEALDDFFEQPIHILFLDIPADGENNVAFLEDLKYERPQIIVTSEQINVATHAFDIDAVDFILKPLTVPRLAKAIAKALKLENYSHKELSHGEPSIFLKVDHKFLKVDLKDIYLVEGLSDYVNIYTPVKRYTVHGTMKSMEDRLPATEFIRVHKSYIVRIDHIMEVERETLTIEKRTIPVGSTYRQELLEKLKII